jgi:hypothetical protein
MNDPRPGEAGDAQQLRDFYAEPSSHATTLQLDAHFMGRVMQGPC